jgi:hypothetical protein
MSCGLHAKACQSICINACSPAMAAAAATSRRHHHTCMAAAPRRHKPTSSHLPLTMRMHMRVSLRMRLCMRGQVAWASPARQAELPQAVNVHEVAQLQAAQLPASACCFDSQAAQAPVVLQAGQVRAAGTHTQTHVQDSKKQRPSKTTHAAAVCVQQAGQVRAAGAHTCRTAGNTPY